MIGIFSVPNPIIITKIFGSKLFYTWFGWNDGEEINENLRQHFFVMEKVHKILDEKWPVYLTNAIFNAEGFVLSQKIFFQAGRNQNFLEYYKEEWKKLFNSVMHNVQKWSDTLENLAANYIRL